MTESGRDKLQIVGHLNPELEVPFSRKEYERRRSAVRAQMSAAGIATLYVSDPESMNYLCGYKALWYQAYGHSGWGPVGGLALNADSDKTLLFDTEKERVLGGYSTLGVEFHLLRRYAKPLIEFVIEDLADEGWLNGSVGLEMESYRPFPSLSREFQSRLEAAGAEVTDATNLIRECRRSKSSPEIAQIRTAARIADLAIERGMELLGAGVSENFVYGEMYRTLTAAGGDVPAMTPQIRSGPRTATRHASPSKRTIVPGDLVILSVFGCFNRYHSFVSRTAVIGDVGDELGSRIDSAAAKALELMADPSNDGAAAFLDRARSGFEPGMLAAAGGHELGVAFPPDAVGHRNFNDLDAGTAFEVFREGDSVALEISLLVPELSGCAAIGDTVLFGADGATALSAVSPEIRRVGRS